MVLDFLIKLGWIPNSNRRGIDGETREGTGEGQRAEYTPNRVRKLSALKASTSARTPPFVKIVCLSPFPISISFYVKYHGLWKYGNEKKSDIMEQDNFEDLKCSFWEIDSDNQEMFCNKYPHGSLHYVKCFCVHHLRAHLLFITTPRSSYPSPSWARL